MSTSINLSSATCILLDLLFHETSGQDGRHTTATSRNTARITYSSVAPSRHLGLASNMARQCRIRRR